jgi:hypothetical protein
MHNKIMLMLFGVLFLGALLCTSIGASPASAATLNKAQAVANTHILSRRDYERGFRDGRITANRFCEREDFPNRHEHARHESDYERGFQDGFDFTLEYSHFCHRHRR